MTEDLLPNSLAAAMAAALQAQSERNAAAPSAPSPSTQPSAKPASTTPTRPAPVSYTTPTLLSPVVANIMASEAYKNPNHPGHRDAVAQLNQAYRDAYPEPEPSAENNPAMDIDSMRREVGVDVRVPEPFEQDWSVSDEGDFYGFVQREGIPSDLAQ